MRVLKLICAALMLSPSPSAVYARSMFIKPAPAGCVSASVDDGTIITTNRCDAYFMIAFCVREEGTANSRLYMRPNIVPNGEDNFSPFTVSNVKFTYTLLTGQLPTDEEWDPKC
jgi:hypothetical protein